MTGPKLNEGVLLLADEAQVSTKATARYLRGSASKARAVLDLIRGLDVRRADEVLQFTERAAAQDVRKVLASAVANAVHNDNQDADELFVLACFADEGPTLKRFRPRARGRASRIRKRTSHITVIVARMSDARLEVVQARQASSTAAGRRIGPSAQSRRDRVARSRARAEGLRGGAAGGATDDATAEDVVADESSSADDLVEAELPDGAVAPTEDGEVPDGYAIKGNASSMKYHVPAGRYYEVTNADVYFDTVENAEAAGYEAPVTDDAAVEETIAEEAEAGAESPTEAEEADPADATDDAGASAPDRSDDETETGVASASEQPESSHEERSDEEEDR